MILTGGTETALQMLRHRPETNLLAETGGKNATIVTSLADRELAVKHVIHSAFSHSGQKCSAHLAANLGTGGLRRRRVSGDFVRRGGELDCRFRPGNCTLGSVRSFGRRQISSRQGLKELEPGESWAVRPRLHVDDNPRLVSPGVKWGVSPKSFTHCTEFFGPLLGVMPARNLHEAISLVNATGYGLTSGLESLDEREHEIWQRGIRAGNLYINRSTTGAIVLRQPFGGMGKSAFGPGVKAGGPNYMTMLMKVEDVARDATEGAVESIEASVGPESKIATPSDDDAHEQSAADIAVPPGHLQMPHESLAERRQQLHALRDRLLAFAGGAKELQSDASRVAAAIEGYLHWIVDEFEQPHDHFRLVGEDNYRRYLPVENLRIRVHPEDSLFETFARAAAARAAGCRAIVSVPPGYEDPMLQMLDHLTDSWAGAIEFYEESDDALAAEIAAQDPSLDAESDGTSYVPPNPVHSHRLRYAAASRVPLAVRQAAATSFSYVADAPVLAHGRFELLWYFREQSLSHVYHRYGNLGQRSDEKRAEAL